jgi:hypothetical protein
MWSKYDFIKVYHTCHVLLQCLILIWRHLFDYDTKPIKLIKMQKLKAAAVTNVLMVDMEKKWRFTSNTYTNVYFKIIYRSLL